MRVEVLLFGPLADLAGQNRVSVDAHGARPTAREVLDTLAQDQPRLRQTLSVCRVAVNHALANDETPIEPDDEVAIIGLFSGG